MNTSININNNTSFRSTLLPNSSSVKFLQIAKQLDSSFDLMMQKDMKEAAKNIDYGKACFYFDKGRMFVMGKDEAADKFIFNRLKAILPNVEYFKDVVEKDGQIIYIA